MAVFTYTALSSDGKQTNGSVPAESRAAAIAAVSGRGLTPVRVEEQHTDGKGRIPASEERPVAGGRVTQKHVEAFTRELANLLAGGVPLARALFLLKREASQAGPKAMWGEIHEDVVGGLSLGDALAQHPGSFSQIYVAMVRAGEAGGFLELVLGQIADFRTREADLKGKIKGAMIYPAVLGVMAIGVMIFLLTFFIPRFSAIFSQFGSSLPSLTKAILFVSSLVTQYGLILLAAVIVAVVMIRRMAGTDAGRRQIERAMLGTKGVGDVVAHFALVRFCRMLGTLLTAGVPLVTSLRVAKEAIGNQTLADTVSHGIEQVQRGESLARALGEAKKLFPAGVIEMIAIAEETGRLDKELVRLAAAYESELDRKLRMLVSLAEPLLLFLMAGLIGTIVLGMLLPVFDLQELIK